MVTESIKKEIKLCYECYGSGIEEEHAGQGMYVKTGRLCITCNGSGRLVYENIINVSPFVDSENGDK